MEEKKNIPLDNELNDEELEKATGGYQPATQSATKPCASYGCPNLVPANGFSPFCDDCQKRMRKKVFTPIV